MVVCQSASLCQQITEALWASYLKSGLLVSPGRIQVLIIGSQWVTEQATLPVSILPTKTPKVGDPSLLVGLFCTAEFMSHPSLFSSYKRS